MRSRNSWRRLAGRRSPTLALVCLATAIVGTHAAPAALATGATAQRADQAEVQLQAALHVELSEGDLERAIELYRGIVNTYAGNPNLVARALLRMGQCYEKLGKPEAQDIYRRVLSAHADQAEPVAAARARLAALEVEPESASPALHTELVWALPCACWGNGDVSPDGSLATWTKARNLQIRDLATGEDRPLTHSTDRPDDAGFPDMAVSSRFSPDGEQVIYTWYRADNSGELRLLSVHGDRTEPRTIWNPADGGAARAQGWFPSGDRVVAVVSTSSSTQHLVTVGLVDGQVRQVHSSEWGGFRQVRVSPDGRYLAYSRSASREVAQGEIFLVAVDGSSGSVVVQHAAHDELVAWSPDGTHLLFSSDRSGQPALWAQRVHDAAPVGEPLLLVPNLDVGRGMGVTRDGTLHYLVSASSRRLKIAELDMKTGRLLGPPMNATEQFVGSNMQGVFSPDGETLAYISARGRSLPEEIVIRSLKTREERSLPHAMGRSQTLSKWSDNDRLVVQGYDNRGRYGQYAVSVATGQTRPLSDIPAMIQAVFTPDGTQILYHHDRSRSSNYKVDASRIYSYRVADGSVQVLPGVFPGRWSLSPDGQWIATTRTRSDYPAVGSDTEIRLHPVAGGNSDVLWTTDESEPFGGRGTTWTPDGALLVHKKEPQAGEYMWRLWVVPIDGSAPVATELVYRTFEPGRVDIHPDGTRIVYVEVGSDPLQQLWAVRNLALLEPDSP